MNRRELLTLSLAAIASRYLAAAPIRTRWTIRGSEGFDALSFLGPLSGGALYTPFYRVELVDFAPRFSAEGRDALSLLRQGAESVGALLAPSLCTLFSGGPDASLDDLIASLDQAEARLLPPYRASAYWDRDGWNAFLAGRPALMTVLRALRAADFPAFRRRFIDQRLTRRVSALQGRLASLDVIAEQERLMGRRLRPGIEIILLWFSNPHGTRVQGQRFLSHVDYPDDVVIRIAAHEIMHPPFPMDGPAAQAALSVLRHDPLFARIVAEHDPAFGYNSLKGLLDEDTVQALDQIIAERLGFALPPAERWASADDGMHVLAAGLYGTLKAEGYDRQGGRIAAWMIDAARSGKLAPTRLHAQAARVMGVSADQLWRRPSHER